MPTTTGGADGGTLRRAIIALVMVGAVGLLAELVLLEHYEDPWQWAPLGLLGVGLPLALLAALRPGASVLRSFRVLMVLYVVAGLVGVVLHLKGNVEFELERNPALRGLPLAWEVLRGATPALAPGALAQLGLLGLLFTFRHPALARRPAAASAIHRTETP